MTACPFCEINEGRAPAEFVHEWSDAIAIVPLNPVVEGHTLVIPKTHVTDFAEDPAVSAATMRRAADLADRLLSGSMNLITSRGREATQSVFHLHLHLVPRAENDGLALPWYSGRRKQSSCGPECSEMHSETGRCEIARNRRRPVAPEEAP
ncbi:HIT family protein [Streptomyces parvus]|uniref:HIT family protein n=1 Tax=Streptomyces parvus TaxID=66428 RepID=UPI0033167469